MKIKIILSFILLFINHHLQAQIKDTLKNYILCGTVVNGLTNELLIGAHLHSSQRIGTNTDESGTFLLEVLPNDTIRVSYIGFKTLHYTTPYHEKGKYLIKFNLFTDSITLDEVEIFPWPSYDEFKKAFVELKPTEPEIIIMEGVKMYQDRTIKPIAFPPLTIISNPISFMYDKLLDKKSKQLRQINRHRKTIRESSFIEND